MRLPCLSVLALSPLVACNDHTVAAYNEPPTVTIQEPTDGSTFYDGQAITFQALVRTHDKTEPDELEHYWTTGNETMCEKAQVTPDGSAICSFAFDNTGEYTVTATVDDPGFGLVNSPSITVIIDENQPPSITITAPTDGEEYATDELIIFEALVDDSEESSDDLVVKLASSIDGDLGVDGQPASSGAWTAGTYLTEGEHLITARVYDSYGRSDQDTVTLEVYAHGPPSVESVTITPSPAYTDDDLTAEPQGWEDLDGAPERYRFAWYITDDDGNLTLDSGETTNSYPNGKTTKGDLVQVVVTPYNDYGEGDPVSSPTKEIQNSAPDEPVVAITPSSPEPEDNLGCGIATPSSDEDGDAISYSYEWYKNGILTANVTSVVTASETTHGDTWECVVTPSDGEDEGPSGSDSVTVSDVSAPDDPTIDTPSHYRNDEEVTLTGDCEAGCTLTFYCSDSTTSWTDTETCSSSGEFEYTTALSRGDATSCYADCEDSAGNVSGYSNTVSTEVCDPADEYEDSTGYGDDGANAIDEWSAISDSGTTTITIEGNVLDDDTEDWYVVSTSDDLASDRAAGIDYYNFAVELTTGTSEYAFIVYKGTSDPTDTECPTYTTGYTEYNDYVEDVGDGSHSIPSDTRKCSTSSSSYNNCQDMSNSYYIQVFRRSSSVTSCQHYELEITNGVW